MPLVPQVDSMRGSFSHESHAILGANQPLMGAQLWAPPPHGNSPRVIHEKSASRSQVIPAPSRPASPSDLAWRAASSPWVWRPRSVVAVAIPVGNGSFSTLIIWRLAGTARNTPSSETTVTQGISHRQRVAKAAGITVALSIMSAGMAFETPPPGIEPADEATDWSELFSRMLKAGKNFGTARCRAAKKV